MRLVTYNIHGGVDSNRQPSTDRIVEILGSLRPHVVCLQEFTKGLPFRAGSISRRLEHELGAPVAFGPALGMSWWGFGNAVATRLPIVGVTNHPLPNEGERGAGKVFWERRRALEVRVEAGPDVLTVFCTHWSLDAEDRIRSAAHVAELVRACKGPVVVAGDLNCLPDAPELSLLLEAGRLCDSGAEGGAATFPSVSPRSRIDYVLHSKDVEITSCEVATSDASDHLPVVVEW